MDTDPHVVLNIFDIYADTEMAPWLHEIRSLALVLMGELDGGCNPRINKRIAAALPDSELVILEVIKHAILIEPSYRVLPPIKCFLLDHKGASTPNSGPSR